MIVESLGEELIVRNHMLDTAKHVLVPVLNSPILNLHNRLSVLVLCFENSNSANEDSFCRDAIMLTCPGIADELPSHSPLLGPFRAYALRCFLINDAEEMIVIAYKIHPTSVDERL